MSKSSFLPSRASSKTHETVSGWSSVKIAYQHHVKANYDVYAFLMLVLNAHRGISPAQGVPYPVT